jgi:large subunit ribosomal protein L5
MSQLKQIYNDELRKKLKEEFGIKNDFAVPRLSKIVINIGVGEAKDDKSVMDKVNENLKAISGQKPVITKAKKSISNFKLVKGAPIGIMVTLRGQRMYDFLEKLITVVLPKVRDFRGIPTTSFDSQGNYSLGLREQIIFPEIDYRNVDKVRGMQISIISTAEDVEKGRRLLELLGMPFKKNQ